MKFIILVVLLAILIAFIVMVVKAAKHWRWYHITSAVIVMLLSLILLFPTAMALKSRQSWHKVKEDLELRLEQVKQDNRRLQRGDPDDPSAGIGVKQLSSDLFNVGVETGRRWRNLQMVGVDASSQVTLREMTVQQNLDPGADPAAAAQANRPLAPKDLVVYGFGETPFPGVDRPVPTVYLGEFKITASAPGSVTIVPTVQLERNQINIITGGAAKSWALYEMLPLDGHEPFIAEESKADDDNVLGRVDEQLVNTILKNASPETLNKYLIDGQRGAPEDRAARWVKVRFEKKYTKDVDSKEQRSAVEGGFFDNSGRSVDSRLQRSDGGSVTFKIGDTLVVKEEVARELIDQEKVASLVDTYYIRPLNDYRYVLRHIRLQIKQLDTRIAEMEYEKKVLEAATAATVDVLDSAQNEKLALEKDRDQYQVENKALQEYFTEVREKVRKIQERSRDLYRSNIALTKQIQQFSDAAIQPST